MSNDQNHQYHLIGSISDLVAGSGVAALIACRQVALFYLPAEQPCVYAIDNRDPFSDANILSRGIVGDIGGELVVASPMYKQHFSLTTGRCIEDETVSVQVWPVRLDGDAVSVAEPVGGTKVESAA